MELEMLFKHNSLRRHFTILFTLAALALLALTPPAIASTVLQLDMQSLVANSDQIVIGRVANLESYLEKDGRVYTAITIDVDESLKGQPDKQLVIRQIGGRTDDLATIVPGMPDFKPQEEVVLFLELHQAKKQQPDLKIPVITGMSQGKFTVAIGPDDKTRFVVPHLAGVHRIQPARHAPTHNIPDNKPNDNFAIKNIDPATLHKLNADDLHTQVVEINAFKKKIQDVITEQSKK